MKNIKKFTILVLVFVMLMSTTVPAFAEIRTNIVLLIESDEYEVPEDYGTVFIDNNSRTQIPVRAVAEKLGFNVAWDSKTYTISLTKGEQYVNLQLGSNIAETSNGPVIMDTVAFAIPEEQRTYVPLRFVSEALGYEVGYEYYSGNHFIKIYSPEVAEDEKIVITVDGIPQRLQDNVWPYNRVANTVLGLVNEPPAGYWDGKSDLASDILLINEIIDPWAPGDSFNDNGYSKNLPISFGRDSDGNPLVRIRNWRKMINPDDFYPPNMTATMNYFMELIRFYVGNDEDAMLIINYIDNAFIAEDNIPYGELITIGNTDIIIDDPGYYGLDVRILN